MGPRTVNHEDGPQGSRIAFVSSPIEQSSPYLYTVISEVHRTYLLAQKLGSDTPIWDDDAAHTRTRK